MLYGLLRTTDYHKGIADTFSMESHDLCSTDYYEPRTTTKELQTRGENTRTHVHAELRLRSNRRSAGDLLRRGGVGEEEGGDAEDGEDEGGVLGLAVLGRLVHGAHLLPVDPASEAGRDAVGGAHLRDGGARLDGHGRRHGADGVALEQLAAARLGVLLLLERVRVAVLSVHADRRSRDRGRRHAGHQRRGDREERKDDDTEQHLGSRGSREDFM